MVGLASVVERAGRAARGVDRKHLRPLAIPAWRYAARSRKRHRGGKCRATDSLFTIPRALRTIPRLAASGRDDATGKHAGPQSLLPSANTRTCRRRAARRAIALDGPGQRWRRTRPLRLAG